MDTFTSSLIRADEKGNSFLQLTLLCGFPTFGLTPEEYREHIWFGLKRSKRMREELALLAMSLAEERVDFLEVAKHMDEGQEEILANAVAWLAEANFDYSATTLKIES